MQILVLSDSHGKYDTLRDVLLAHLDADMAIHCGDGEQDVSHFLEEYPERRGWIHIVRGNCDRREDIPNEQVFQLPYGHRAFVVHGHAQMYGDYIGHLVHLAKQHGADLVLFGHTHIRMERIVNNVIVFNPGSTAQPRDGMPEAYGLIDVLPTGIQISYDEVRNTSLEYMHVF